MSPSRTQAFNLASSSSPLSPRMDSFSIPPQARRPRMAPHHRQSSSGTAASLRLPSLPRFHPANFPSGQSSAAATPGTGPGSPQPPLSPRTYQKKYSDAQRQMYLYQRDLAASNARQARSSHAKPTSPRLNPMGSPGPVTPLELEGADGYLTSGMNSAEAASHVDKLIKEEARRRGENSSGRPTSVGGR